MAVRIGPGAPVFYNKRDGNRFEWSSAPTSRRKSAYIEEAQKLATAERMADPKHPGESSEPSGGRRIGPGAPSFLREMKTSHTYYMQEALKEAIKAFERDEVPVGAVVVYKNRIIARAHNQILTLKDPTAHAEMIALTQAADYLKNERLITCSLYVTIEPCAMCAGACVLARVKKIIYGSEDPKSGACGSVINIANNRKLNHRIEVISGMMREDCAYLVKEFFKNKRSGKH